ncbi:MAG: hypothetical protein K9L56_13030 [Clostridiales bacterium]|nr:hypothetical protein [Clostridiales bacterium]
MKRLFLYLIVGLFATAAAISPYLIGDVNASNDDPRPQELIKARQYEQTNKLEPAGDRTIDLYDKSGDYVVTVPIKLFKKHQEKSIDFWKENREKFIKEYNMPKSDPEGNVDWENMKVDKKLGDVENN